MSTMNFNSLNQHKSSAFQAVINYKENRENILNNDRYSKEYRNEQLESAEQNAENTVNNQLESLTEKYEQELERLRVEWETTDEHQAEIPAVQERIGDTKEPGELFEKFQEIVDSDEPDAFKEMAYRLIVNRLKGQGADGYVKRVEDLRKKELLSEDERQSMNVVEAAESAKETATEGLANNLNDLFYRVKQGNYDNKDVEELEKNLQEMVDPLYTGSKEKIQQAAENE